MGDQRYLKACLQNSRLSRVIAIQNLTLLFDLGRPIVTRLHVQIRLKLQLDGAIYPLRFYSNSLIHILSLSNSHNNAASIQKNRGDKSHRVIVALWVILVSMHVYPGQLELMNLFVLFVKKLKTTYIIFFLFAPLFVKILIHFGQIWT